MEVGVHHEREPTERRDDYGRRKQAEPYPALEGVGTSAVLEQRSEREPMAERKVPVRAVGIDADPVRAFHLGGIETDGDDFLDREIATGREPHERDFVSRLGCDVEEVRRLLRVRL